MCWYVPKIRKVKVYREIACFMTKYFLKTAALIRHRCGYGRSFQLRYYLVLVTLNLQKGSLSLINLQNANLDHRKQLPVD